MNIHVTSGNSEIIRELLGQFRENPAQFKGNLNILGNDILKRPILKDYCNTDFDHYMNTILKMCSLKT